MEYDVVLLKAMKSGKNLAYIHEGKASEAYILLIADLFGWFGLPEYGIDPHDNVAVVGVDSYKTIEEAENVKEEWEKYNEIYSN